MPAHNRHPDPDAGTGYSPVISGDAGAAQDVKWAAVTRKVTTFPLIVLARLWQFGPSRLLPPTCRYDPTCSAYAIQAWSRYGALAGSWLALKRLLRCHPWGGCGADPLP